MELIRNRKPAGFRPSFHYCAEADALTFYFRPDEFYASRVDDVLTVYLAMEGDELVGCQVKGIRHALEKCDAVGLEIEDDNVDLSFVFLLNGIRAAVTAKPRYLDLARLALEHRMRGRISGRELSIVPAQQCEPPSLCEAGR
jgi:hypothetical protein